MLITALWRCVGRGDADDEERGAQVYRLRTVPVVRGRLAQRLHDLSPALLTTASIRGSLMNASSGLRPPCLRSIDA